MLVLCVGMYRACSTWQYGVVGELLGRHRDGQRLGFVDGGRFGSEVLPTLEPGRWSVLKAHDAHRRFAERLDRGQALGIYSHRDLRDVAFSWMHKTGQTFDEMIGEGFLNQCLRNDWFWRDRPGMLLQSYESLIAEPARGVAEIAGHLGIELDSGEDRAIADLLSLEANRKRTKDLSERLQAEGVALDSKDQGRFDGKTLLHWNHIRDGRAGTWQELASPEQRATLARICGPWLVEHGYPSDPDPAFEAAPIEVRPIAFSHPSLDDVLLDRVFQGKKGTYFNFGASRPTSINRASGFYLRGWRGVNVEPVPSAIESLAEGRPDDLNLQVADPDVAALIEEHGLFPPDIFSIGSEGREGKILGSIPLAGWRPKVFVIEADSPGDEPWEPILLAQGYVFAASDGINRFYLRGDLADRLICFEGPAVAELVERLESAILLTRHLEAERRRAEDALTNMNDFKVELAQLKFRFGNELEDRHRHYLAWLDEREGWRVEREAMTAEREAWDLERHALRADSRALQADRVALQAECQSLRAERDALQAGLEASTARAEGLERDLGAQVREVDSLHGVIGRLLGEIEARDVQLDRTRTQLGPYLKIDRLGVVPAIQRKVHAHRTHQKA